MSDQRLQGRSRRRRKVYGAADQEVRNGYQFERMDGRGLVANQIGPTTAGKLGLEMADSPEISRRVAWAGSDNDQLKKFIKNLDQRNGTHGSSPQLDSLGMVYLSAEGLEATLEDKFTKAFANPAKAKRIIRRFVKSVNQYFDRQGRESFHDTTREILAAHTCDVCACNEGLLPAGNNSLVLVPPKTSHGQPTNSMENIEEPENDFSDSVSSWSYMTLGVAGLIKPNATQYYLGVTRSQVEQELQPFRSFMIDEGLTTRYVGATAAVASVKIFELFESNGSYSPSTTIDLPEQITFDPPKALPTM